MLKIDLSHPRDRRMMIRAAVAVMVFLFISAVGSYESYEYCESVEFCGRACHTVMGPEMVTYLHSPHARVACVECHVGSGAKWFVKSKMSGTRQVYALLFDKYQRPIPTPVHDLRPAQDTCERCHWPQKFAGNLERRYSYFLGDQTNTPYSVRMLMKVGGGDPTTGPVGGIHWHMSVANTVEYVAGDERRQVIPWVRLTDPQGKVTEFRSAGFTNEIDPLNIRRMDCIDCHNRPSHNYKTPNESVDIALSLGELDGSLPYLKTNAIFALTRSYSNNVEALAGIDKIFSERYHGDAKLKPAIAAVQHIYTNNFFPEMKASWKSYPSNVGHRDWPGCFRCHDGKHKTADGTRTIKADDCNSCHTILAQGSTEEELRQMTPLGQPFKHPGGDIDPTSTCNECHDGTF
jgi:hypothetical protein